MSNNFGAARALAALIAAYAEAKASGCYYRQNAARRALQDAWYEEYEETLWIADADRLAREYPDKVRDSAQEKE